MSLTPIYMVNAIEFEEPEEFVEENNEIMSGDSA